MTREELHTLVWSQPMRTLAKTIGISDVALAKRCRNQNVPVPPRGWWARKQAGQRVKTAPLPVEHEEISRYFPALAPGSSIERFPAALSAEPNPPVPVFRDLKEVKAELDIAIGTVRIASTLDEPHPTVVRLLEIDAKRTVDPSWDGYRRDDAGPRFERPIQQRRLRVLSGILTAFGRLGCEVSGRTHAGEQFYISAGGSSQQIVLKVEGHRWTYDTRSGRAREQKQTLSFELAGPSNRSRPLRSWSEEKEPLESQATDIVQWVLFHAEQHTRASALETHKRWAEHRVDLVRQAHLDREKTEADRIAREEVEAAARIQRLIDGAEALERADRIRRYVAAVEARNAASPKPVSEPDMAAWRRWALAEADRIDPVTSGAFCSEVAGALHDRDD